MTKINLSKIPSFPGCYLYKNKSGKIIYVGKAKNLKKRVLSYFSKKDLDQKTKVLVKNIFDIDFIVTNSENEAFLLENSLIKKYKPKYNIELKDSKSYAFIEVTNETFPRLIVSRKSKLKNKKNPGNVYGPFVSAEDRTNIMKTLNKTFQLRTCKKLPKKKCLRYDLGLCSAPCIKKISEEDYSKDVKKAELILKGKDKELVSKIKKAMGKESANKNYEKAILYRNQLDAINYLIKKQNVERQKKFNEDIMNFAIKGEEVYLMVFNIEKGTLFNKQDFFFKNKQDFFEEFILRYYSENEIPKKIIAPKNISNSLKNFLEYKREKKIRNNNSKKRRIKVFVRLSQKKY